MSKAISTIADQGSLQTASPASLRSLPSEDAPLLNFRKRILLCMISAFVGAVVEIASFYPGYINSDSLDQLLQARQGVYLLYHPPVMAWIWRPLDAVFPGPIGMLVLQNALLWGGIAILVALASRRWWAMLLVLVVGFAPPIVAQLSTVWKDSQMGAALVAAWALLLLGRYFSSALALLASIPLLVYASAVRSNGPAAVFPIAVLLGVTLFELKYRSSSRWKRLAAGVLTGVLLVQVGLSANNALGVRGTAAPFQGPLLHDLIGMSFDTGRNELPGYLQHGPHAADFDSLRSIYAPDNLDPLFWTKGRTIWITYDSDELKQLYVRWLQAVSQHPMVYLRHRLILFSGMLGIGVRDVIYPFQWQVEPNSLGIVKTKGILNKWAMRYLESTRNSIFFRAWVYLLMTLVTILVSFRFLPSRSALLSLAFSIYLYAFAYLVVAPTGAFRYIWWSVIGSLLMPLTLWAERRRLPLPATGPRGLDQGNQPLQSPTVSVESKL